MEQLNLHSESHSHDLERLKDENSYLSEQNLGKMEQISELTLQVNAKKQELDTARLEIELASQQIDADVSLKMKDIEQRIAAKEHEQKNKSHVLFAALMIAQRISHRFALPGLLRPHQLLCVMEN